eukprot:symbB.v1.2.017263.t1/scaffold1346.1/size178581/16
MATRAPMICGWLRNDLRCHDSPVLCKAQELAAKFEMPVLLVYVLDPRYFCTSPFGVPRTGPFRQRFLLESLKDLKANLIKLGSDLLILSGQVEEVLPKLLPAGSTLVTQEESTFDEIAIDAALKSKLQDQGVLWEYCWGSTLFHKEDLSFDVTEMPDSSSADGAKVTKPTFW